MKKITLFAFLLTAVQLLSAQPKTEIRAVWLSTNYALDWPQTDKNAASQQKKLQTMLDQLKAINVNTVFFQIQCRSDVFWESEYQPWSRHITGKANQKPSYDVLQFAIDECRKRGMEIHGWVIPYPQGSVAVARLIGDRHTSKTRPDLSILYENNTDPDKWEWYLDPGLPATTDYLLDLYSEVIERYDLDALHLDYTRYPDANFPDSESYATYGGGKPKAQWRRDNINNFVHRLYDLIKEKKPDMKLSAAPIGAYESLAPEAPSGFTARDHVFQDPVEWMSAGKLDMAAPQVYWQPNYEAQVANWFKKSSDRPIVSGIAAYKMLPPKDGEDWAATVVTGQIDRARQLGAEGICFFRTEQITDNLKGIYKLLQEGAFKYPANLPPARWLEPTQPKTPQQVSISKKDDDTYTISWQQTDDAKYYCVYTSTTPSIDISDVKNLAAHYVTGTAADYTVANTGQNHYFTVTAFDKGYYESTPSSVVSTHETAGLFGISNPATVFSHHAGMLQISAETAINSVRIYVINGSLLASDAYGGLQVTLSTDALPQGVYIVIASLADGSTAQHKFIK